MARGEQINLSEFSTLVNALSRTLVRLGLKRVPRDVTPSLGQLLRNDLHQREEEEP